MTTESEAHGCRGHDVFDDDVIAKIRYQNLSDGDEERREEFRRIQELLQ